MKKGKRIALILITALAMVIAFSVTAFAASDDAFVVNRANESSVMWANGVTSEDGLSFKVWNLKCIGSDDKAYAEIPVMIVAPNSVKSENRFSPLVKWDNDEWGSFYTGEIKGGQYEKRIYNKTFLRVDEEMIRDAIKDTDGIIMHTCQCDWTGDKIVNDTFNVTIDVTDAELYDKDDKLIVQAKAGEIISHHWAYYPAIDTEPYPEETNKVEFYCEDELCEYAKGKGFTYELEMDDEYIYGESVSYKIVDPKNPKEDGFPEEHYNRSVIKWYEGEAKSLEDFTGLTYIGDKAADVPTDVGKYTAKINLRENTSGTYVTRAVLFKTFEIIPEVTATPAEGVTYGDGTELVSVVPNSDGCVVTYSLDKEDGVYSENVPAAVAGVDAGPHTVFFKVEENDVVYNDSIKVKISRAPVTVNWGEEPFTYKYSGEPQGPDPTIEGAIEGESLEPVFKTKHPNKQIEAGKYTAEIKGVKVGEDEGTANPKNYTFDKNAELTKEFKITRALAVELSMDDFIYGGEDIQAPKIIGEDADLVNNDEDGRFDIVWQYSENVNPTKYDHSFNTVDELLNELSCLDAGEHAIRAVITDTEGVFLKGKTKYAAYPAKAFTITPAELTIDVYDRYEFYGYRVEDVESSGYELEGLVNDDTEDNVIESISFTINDDKGPIEPNTKLGLTSYDIVAEATLKTKNYVATYEKGTLIIEALTDNEVTFKWIKDAFTYGDKVGRPVATATYCQDDEPTISIALATSDTTKPKNWKLWRADKPNFSKKIPAGTYIVKAEVEQYTGYAGGVAYSEFTVEKKAATIKLIEQEPVEYNGETYMPEKTAAWVEVTGTVNDEGLNYEIVSDPVSIKNAGTYELDASFDPDDETNANYDITVEKGSFTINKKAATIKLHKFNPRNYDGKTHIPKKTWATVEGAISGENLEYEVVSDPEPIKNAGTYELDASFDPDDETNANYDITVVKSTGTINPIPLTVTAINRTKVYGDPDPTNYENPVQGDDYTVEGLLPADEEYLNVALSRRTTHSSNYVGKHPINIKVIGDADILNNYEITEETGNLTISKATLTINAREQTKTYGDNDRALRYNAAGFKYRDTVATELTGSLTRDEGEDVGDYDIKQGSLSVVGHGQSDVENYTIDFHGAVFHINPATLTITAKNQTITTGSDFDKTSVAYSGWKRGDDVTALTTAPVVTSTYDKASSPAGTYPLTPADAVAKNYIFSYIDGTLTVNSPAPTPPGPEPVHDPVADLVKMINDLPAPSDVTVNDKDAIEAAQAAYDALSAGQKTDPRLTADLMKKLTDCEAALEQAETDQEKAKEAGALIDNLPADPTQADPDQAWAAYAAYMALTDAQKALLTDAEKQTIAAYKYYYEVKYAKAKTVKSFKVKNIKTKKANCTWAATADVDGYKITYKAKGVKSKKVYASASATKKIVKKLKKNKKYTFKICTYNEVYNPTSGAVEKVFGKTSTKKVKIKK